MKLRGILISFETFDIFNPSLSIFRSSIAQHILDNWEVESKKFIKVFPYEYQKVLQEIAASTKVTETNGLKNGNSNGIEVLITKYFFIFLFFN